MWQYYDQRDSLREGLLRQLFLCLRFEGSEGTQRLAAVLDHARLDLSDLGVISKANIDRRLPPKKQLPLLQDQDGVLGIFPRKRTKASGAPAIPGLPGGITLPNQ